MWTEKEVDDYIKEEIQKGSELGKMLKDDPEKQKAYKFKLLDSQMGGAYKKITNDYPCKTCIFAEVIKPIGVQPQTHYCEIYERANSERKPDEVLYGNEPCEYYEKE